MPFVIKLFVAPTSDNFSAVIAAAFPEVFALFRSSAPLMKEAISVAPILPVACNAAFPALVKMLDRPKVPAINPSIRGVAIPDKTSSKPCSNQVAPGRDVGIPNHVVTGVLAQSHALPNKVGSSPDSAVASSVGVCNPDTGRA